MRFGLTVGEAHDKLQMTDGKWRMLGANPYLLFAIRSVPLGPSAWIANCHACQLGSVDFLLCYLC